MKEIIDIVHKSIYSFFDVCEDGKEEPLSDKDKLLLSVNKAICNNLKALEQETCEDCISRQAVLDMQYRINDSATLSARDVVNVEDIEQLPSVTPAEKIGRWIFNDKANEHAHCSECGHGNVDLVNGKTHNYCECCGAKMEMPENRDDKMSREDAIRYCDEYLARSISNIDKEFLLRVVKEALWQELQEEVKADELIHRKCNQCKYYEGVHDVRGHAPCSYHNIGGVMWDWYCPQFDRVDKGESEE